MMATRSATCSTSASTCPEKITVCPLRTRFLNERQHDAACRRVERGSGLIKDQDLHWIGEDLCQSQLLLHAGRICSQLSVEVELHDALGNRDGAIKADPVTQIREHSQGAVTGHRAEHPKLAGEIGYEPSHVEAIPPAVEAGDIRPPRGRSQQAQQDPNRRRLSGPVWTQQPVNLPGAHLQTQRPERNHAAVNLG